jgi:glycosyltransferase involved in cell wall biosynthesis
LSIEPSLIDAEPPRHLAVAAKAWAAGVRRDRADGMLAPEIVKLRELTARLRARRQTADACVQMGSDFGEPVGVRRVTFEDMTVAQALRLPSPEARLRSAPSWIARQRRNYANTFACCVASHWAAGSVVDDYGIDPDRVHVVGFGRNFDPVPRPKDRTVPRFLFAGLDWERKNGPMLMRAFARLRTEIPDARLDLVGETPPIDAAGVTVHGRLDRRDLAGRAQMERLFEEATCFVMPSQYEPFGMVYVEAAAAGVPSIGTTLGGAGEAIGPGGVLVDPTDERALLDAMRRFANPEHAAAAGRAARERSTLFTWRQVAERVVRALELPGISNESLAPFL